MHELLLFGQVPQRSQDLVLKVLAGISATQPRVHSSQHLIFKPTRSPQSVVAAAQAARASKPGAATLGTQQSSDIFYLQLVGHLSEKESQEEDPIGEDEPTSSDRSVGKRATQDDAVVSLKRCPWSLEFRDLPEVHTRRRVTSRLMSSMPIAKGEPIAFVEAIGYDYLTSYLQHGHELIHNNIQLLLTRTFPIPQQPTTSSPPAVPGVSSLKPLDASGGYVLQASLRVADGSKPEIMSKGAKDLLTLKDMLKGVVELEMGDRLALDTRVR